MEDDDELLQQAIMQSMIGSSDASLSLPISEGSHGELVSNAQVSQYSFEGGRSACTIIATIAAAEVLGGADEDFNESNIGKWVSQGVECYGSIISSGGSSQEHTSLDDIWGHEALRPITGNLERGALINGAVSLSAFQGMIRDARNFASQAGSPQEGGFDVALVITKPPETIMLALCHGSSESILFDSHNRPMRGFEGAHALRFKTDDDAAAGLCEPFPAVQGMEDFGFAGEMMNQFDATPLFLASTTSSLSKVPSSAADIQVVPPKTEMKDEDEEALQQAIQLSMGMEQ